MQNQFSAICVQNYVHIGDVLNTKHLSLHETLQQAMFAYAKLKK